MRQHSPSERLEQLLKLAQAYRGWSRKQLAKALGRDPTRLVPQSGNPKLDLVMDLARVMDWSLEDVAAYLTDPLALRTPMPDEGATFDDLSHRSREEHRAGRFRTAVDLARQAYQRAGTAEERAIACVRESVAWDGLGRCTESMEAVVRGLSEKAISERRQLILQSNLAIQYYTLGQLTEARAIAGMLLSHFKQHPPGDVGMQATQAYAHYVRGHSYRRMIDGDADRAVQMAAMARSDLESAIDAFRSISPESQDVGYRGAAQTCAGGLVEVRVALGELSAEDALLKEIEPRLRDLDTRSPVSDELESLGWWCIFGCNIVLRHLTDPRAVEQAMALFTSTADRIAVQLDNWSLRERVFTMEFERRKRFADWTGWEPEWTADRADLRNLTGTLARFPGFRSLGWRMIESHRVVAEK